MNRLWIVALSLTLLWGTTALAVSASKTTTQPLADKLAAITAKLTAEQPGLTVLVRHHDQVLFQKSVGLANKAQKLPISSATGFRIGSISKTFTALAVMTLVERKQLSLDHSVTQYIPKLPEAWDNVTIKHLLTHRVATSQDFFDDAHFALADGATNADLIEFLSSPKVTVTPLAANKARYCNSCYVLLAEVIAKASGMTFSDYLSKAIFKPAGMTDSYIANKGTALKPNLALNYAKTETFFGIHQYNTGAMAQISSLDDLVRFLDALKQHKLVEQQTLARMTQVQSDAGDDGQFGYGWLVGWGEPPFYSHGGSQDGYQSELFIDPRNNLEVIILSNGGDDTYALQAQIVRAVFNHFR